MWPFKKRKPELKVDMDAFNAALLAAVDLNRYQPEDIARDFRVLFQGNDVLGKRVLFMLLTWCGEYEVGDDVDRIPPIDGDELQRWAGKREVAAKIKAAVFAYIEQPKE